MPRADRQPMWRGMGDAIVADLIAGVGVLGAIGYGLDRLFHTWPVLFVVGAFGGYAAGVYIAWRRVKDRSSKSQAHDG